MQIAWGSVVAAFGAVAGVALVLAQNQPHFVVENYRKVTALLETAIWVFLGATIGSLAVVSHFGDYIDGPGGRERASEIIGWRPNDPSNPLVLVFSCMLAFAVALRVLAAICAVLAQHIIDREARKDAKDEAKRDAGED